MRVNDTVPAPGTVFDWDIAEILERESIDVKLDYCYPPSDDIVQAWEQTLSGKREDEWYEDVVASLRRWGFMRPLTAKKLWDGNLHFGDGHHRLAAAIELGMTTVPVKVYSTLEDEVADDSGCWDGLQSEEKRLAKMQVVLYAGTTN